MSNSKVLASYVEQALNAGQSHAQVRANLAAAQWSEAAIDDALSDWADLGSVPPVPRARAMFSVMDLFAYLALLVALALSAFYMITLSLGLIDHALDPPADTNWRADSLVRRARWALAMIVVMGPVYGALVWWTDRDVAANPVKRQAGVRRFAIGLTMLVAAGVFAGDLVYVVFSFLQGDVTLAFLLKALVVGAVAAGLLLIGREDLSAGPGPLKRPILWAGALATVVLIVLTILALGAPEDARNQQADQRTYRELTAIATDLQCRDADVKAPARLTRTAMAEYCNGVRLSFDGEAGPDGAPPHDYRRIDDTRFELCGSFADLDAFVARDTWARTGFWSFNPETGCVEGRIR